MKCIVKEKRNKPPRISDEEIRIAKLQGVPEPKAIHSVRYENTETGEEYLCLAGGFAWPGSKSGYAVVVGVQQAEGEEKPTFKVLEELEEKSVPLLIERSHNLYLKYGKNCGVIQWLWYGDPQHSLAGFIHKFIEGKGVADGHFPLTYAPYYDDPDRFSVYCHVIRSLGQERRLQFPPSSGLVSYLSQLRDEDVHTTTVETRPAIAALGYVLSALRDYQPWLRSNGGSEDESQDSFEDQFIKEAEYWESGGGSGEDFTSSDDSRPSRGGDLIPTIRK